MNDQILLIEGFQDYARFLGQDLVMRVTMFANAIQQRQAKE